MQPKQYEETGWPPKAYNNADFLNSPEARKIRVLCEMTEPEARFREHKIKDTIVLFGSARTRSPEDAVEALRLIEERTAENPNPSPAEALALRQARATAKAAPYYKAAMELAEELTRWSLSLDENKRRFIICSGGGPGIMEAANRGADAAGGPSIGLGISLPFEQGLNPYIPHDLQFEFHYFFIRKYWFVYLAKALVVFPGGFGTMDELFETLTLIQTRKIAKKVPVILFGSEFWNKVIDFETFIDWGMISPEDLDLFKVVDTVEDAKSHLITELTKAYLDAPASS